MSNQRLGSELFYRKVTPIRSMWIRHEQSSVQEPPTIVHSFDRAFDEQLTDAYGLGWGDAIHGGHRHRVFRKSVRAEAIMLVGMVKRGTMSYRELVDLCTVTDAQQKWLDVAARESTFDQAGIRRVRAFRVEVLKLVRRLMQKDRQEAA